MVSHTIDMTTKLDPKILFSLSYYSNGLLQKTFTEAMLGKIVARFMNNSEEQIPFSQLREKAGFLSSLLKNEQLKNLTD